MADAGDAGLCAVSTVAGCLVAPVNRLCGYVISYDSHVRELDHEVAKLSRERQKVQDSINDARNNGKLIRAYVSEWVDKVEKGDKEARHVLDYNKTAKKTCFYGWLPNPKARYCLGREARRKAEDIQKLIDLTPPEKVYDDPPPGRVDDAPDVISLAGDQVDTIFDSRASILEDIMNALDDEKHKVIGIYGEGGVGKTKLLEQVEKKLRNEKRLFDMIVKANVLQNPDLKKIQDDIAYALGLENLKNETSEEGRKDLLFKRLQNDPSEKVLIILDDLWKDLNLRKVGIPSRDESKGCKLLLTSRFKDVLEQMKCDTPIFHLEGLKEREAFRLFEKTVGDRLKDDEELKAIAPKVVKKLAGLPLLIISVACSLKDRDVAAWRIALKKIDQSKIETIVKLSCDHLKSEDTKTLFTNEVRDVLDYDGIAKKTFFYGWFPNPMVRYRLGREVRSIAERIQRLIYWKPSGEVDGPSDVISSDGDQGDTIFDSRASILEDIMNALDHEKHKVVGVYGPGGVGKTTLLEEVQKKLRKEGRPFDMIVKSKVSQTPDLKNIQDDIAYALKMDLKNDPEVGRRDRLFKRLQKDPSEKILIILDDVWKEFDLKEVGIPSGDESRGCKLLLTSRFKDVLEQMKCDTPIFHLTGLKDDEAFELFEKTVGDKLKDDEDLKVIAHQVVNKLAGLPLLIISVASTLKHSNVHTWRTMLIKIEEPNVETIVKLSYDHLKSKDAKTLFLLCGLIGGTIQVETLLALGMGLGLFEEFGRTMQNSRDRLNTILDELRSACLLLDDGNDKNNVTIHELLLDDDDYKNNVTIHDLYSEAVVSTSFRGQNSLMMNSNYGSWSKEKLEKCWAMCLADVDKKRLDELMKCQFPDLKILVVSRPEAWRWKREHECEVGDCLGLLDFTYMKELRVLYFHFMHIASLPPSIGILGNLHSLYLDNCDVQDVAILGKLKALQILSFAPSTISWLPKEIGELTNLRSLNLSKCYNLKTIAPGVLNRLTNLEELHIYHFSQWMGKDQIPSKSCNARLAELKSLTKLASLEISIGNPIILLEDGDLPFENLDKFWISIGNSGGRRCGGLPTMGLNLRGCDGILSRKWVKKNLQKTRYLYLSGCSEFKESPRELCTQGFQEVKCLHIGDSPSIKYIVDSSNDLPLTAFGKLESFFLCNLINLEKICHGPIVLECFNKLKDVRVIGCNRLKYLWRLSDVQRLVQLEEIDVLQCGSMQSIVTHDAGEDIVSTNNRVELPNVRRLRLHELPNMTSFCDASIQVSLPHLEYLIMVGFLDPEKILYGEPSLKYSNLRWLKIRASISAWKSILKLDWILKLPNLESMSLGSSPSAEVVFDLEELKVIKDVEICSRLTKLTLEKLPNLQCMWKWDVKLQGISIFRNLRDLFVYKTGLSFLFSVSVAKCFREIRVIRMWDCPNMKAVIVDEEGRNEVTYDIIEFPLLEHLSIRQCPMKKFFLYPHGKKEPVTTTSDLQDAYSNSFFDRKVTFPNITKLEIGGLLCQEIWNNQIPTDSFQKLESLVLTKCDSLQSIATSYMWKRSQRHLEILKVISCRSIKIIYEGDGMDIESGKLRLLVLRDLENLRCIWQSDKLPNVPFPNLSEIEAVRCPRLEMLFPTFTTKFLRQIKELIVDSCEDMELIAGHEKGEGATHTTITFSKLTFLVLVKLPKFRSSFLPEKYSLKFPCSEDFPSLRNLGVKSCGAEPDQDLGDAVLRHSLRSVGIGSCLYNVLCDKDFDRIERERGMGFWK